MPTMPEEEVTDLKQDFDYIYAGFLQVYGIDLFEHRKMDWRKFQALLKSFPKNTKYREIIAIRQEDESKYQGNELRELRKAKKAVALERG